jgi:hypothetical protein
MRTVIETQPMPKLKVKKEFDPNKMTSSRQIHMLKSKMPAKPVVIKSESKQPIKQQAKPQLQSTS